MTTENTGDDFAPNAPDLPVWGEVTVPLKFPLVFNGATISAITMREPDIEMLEAIEAATKGLGNIAMVRVTVGMLSGVDADALKKLNMRDYTALAEASGPLLEALAESAGDKGTT